LKQGKKPREKGKRANKGGKEAGPHSPAVGVVPCGGEKKKGFFVTGLRGGGEGPEDLRKRRKKAPRWLGRE